MDNSSYSSPILGRTSPAPVPAAVSMDNSSYSSPILGRTSPAPAPVPTPAPIAAVDDHPKAVGSTRSRAPKQRKKDDTELEKKNLIEALYKKLEENKFQYNQEAFKPILEKHNFLSFLKIKHNEPQNRDNRSKKEILIDIGFICYIIKNFKEIVDNIATDIFKNIKKIFNNGNLEIIKYIKDNKISYYFDNYYIIPIIYKYLTFIVNNKVRFIKRDGTFFNFKDIFISKDKHKIDKTLYYLDIMFNVIINKPIATGGPATPITTPSASGRPGRGQPVHNPPSARRPGRPPASGRGRGLPPGTPPVTPVIPMNSPSGTGRGGPFLQAPVVLFQTTPTARGPGRPRGSTKKP